MINPSNHNQKSDRSHHSHQNHCSQPPVGYPEIENKLWEFAAALSEVSVYDRAPLVKHFTLEIEQAKADRYLTEIQVATRWPTLFSRRWLQEARRKRIGPKYSVLHRKIIYRKSDIEDYIERHLRTRA